MTTSATYSETNDSSLTVPASAQARADLDLSLTARGASPNSSWEVPDPTAARPPREFKSIPQPQNQILTLGMKSNGNYCQVCEVAAPTPGVLFVCFVLYILPHSISSQYNNTIVQSSKYSKLYSIQYTDILASCSTI